MEMIQSCVEETIIKNAKHLHKMEERIYKTKYAGYQSSIFDTFNQTALGRDDTYERD